MVRSHARRSSRKEGVLRIAYRTRLGRRVDESVIAAHPEDPNAKLNMFSLGWEQNVQLESLSIERFGR